jgi:LacI family transcriptional regulator
VPKRHATALDVAKLAGVSRSAVSLVLNGQADGNVAKASQERILEAARELDYVPNPVAVSLRNNETKTVGVVTDVLTSPFAGRLIEGAHQVLRAHDFLPLVIDTARNAESVRAALGQLAARRVDALLVAAESMHTVDVSSASIGGLPLVLANCLCPEGMYRAFVPDEVAGARAAAEHLVSLGHSRIAYLSGTRGVLAATQRVQGFTEAAALAGLANSSSVVPTGWDIDDGFRAMKWLMEDSPETTGVVCANDRVALGVVLAALSEGLDVPTDMSVVGYDDEERIAENSVPALTTVALPHRQMGQRAALALLASVEERRRLSATIEVVPCELKVRASTAPPRR